MDQVFCEGVLPDDDFSIIALPACDSDLGCEAAKSAELTILMSTTFF